MNEDVRIIAILDSTDVDNGVKRVENATRRMKQVVEESTNIPSSNAEESGAAMGDAFSRGFIKRLVLRDAIYGIIRGATQVLSTAIDDLDKAVGDKAPFQGFFQSAGHGLSALLRTQFLPSVNRSDVAQTAAEIARERAVRQMQGEVEAGRNNPQAVGSASSLQAKVDFYEKQRQDNQAEYDIKRMAYAQAGVDNPAELQGLRADFESGEKFFSQMEQHLRELVSIAKSRDHKEQAAHRESRNTIERADEFMSGQIRKEALEAEKKEAERTKQAKEQAAKAEKEKKEAFARSLEFGEKSPESDIRDMAKLASLQKATSAVMINGGLFGRSDSASQIATYAGQQVNLLRDMKAQLASIRDELHGGGTLL